MSGFLCLVYHFHRRVVNTVILRVHFMFAQVFYFNWTERTQAGVKGNFGKTDSLDLATLDQFAAEVQSGSRSGHSTFMFGINSLVAFAVLVIRFTLDVFWKRRL